MTNKDKLMRVHKDLEKLLYQVNLKRARMGQKRISAKVFTKKIANRYIKTGDPFYDEFIKI